MKLFAAACCAPLALLPALAQVPAAPAKPIPPARIVSFSVQPAAVRAGEPVVFTWATENPNTVTITPGIGRVTARGTRQVTPAETTTYTLTVTGPNNTVLTRELTVTVTGTAPPSSATQDSGRLANGKPDFSGVYNFASLRNATPPPLAPGAEKFRIHREGDRIFGNTTITDGANCHPLGVPQSFVTPYPIQFVHTPKQLVILFEYPNAFRVIPTDGRPHSEDPDPTFMGESVGRWEGDTLVVDTIGFNDKTEVHGFMHTEALHVIERFTKVDGGLNYEVTVTDPNVWTEPWVLPPRLLPLRPELDKVDEFVCERTPDYSRYFAK
jgi:hypothetical protein